MIDVSEQDPLSFRLHLFCWKRQPLMSILLNTGHQRSPRQVGFRCDFRSFLDGWRLWCLMSSMSSLTSVTSLLSLSLFSSALSCLSSKYTLYTHNLWHLHHPQYPACLHHGQHHHTIVCSSWWRTEIAAIANPSKKHETVNNNSPVTNVLKKKCVFDNFFPAVFFVQRAHPVAGPIRFLCLGPAGHSHWTTTAPPLSWYGKGPFKRSISCVFKMLVFVIFLGMVDFFGRFGHSNLVSQNIFV